MKKPLFAIPSFPGSNGEIDNLHTLRRCGFDAFVFRWNDSREKLHDVDGYFFGAGFSYEDRGRSGMVAARDQLFTFIHEEAERGKIVIGNCNGAQVLVESGLIPLGDGLRMCLARNAITDSSDRYTSPGFLNEWIWMTRGCQRGRCATAFWSGTLHVPIAHGEGRFTTQDTDLITELKQDDQLAFYYCNEQGNKDEKSPVTPNGSMLGVAGICNKEGNVVAIMPHPERTPLGDPYFLSIHDWLKEKGKVQCEKKMMDAPLYRIGQHDDMKEEIFIDTIITNTEERTVEQALRRHHPTISLRQFRYVGLMQEGSSVEHLGRLTFFNPSKEIAYVRRGSKLLRWVPERKVLEPSQQKILNGTTLLRRDLPDTSARGFGLGAETGTVYVCHDCTESELLRPCLFEVLCNPHSSTLQRLHD